MATCDGGAAAGETTRQAGDGADATSGGEMNSSSVRALSVYDLEARVAATMANIWKANPSQAHRFKSPFGGVVLDDDIWDVRFNFKGVDNFELKMGESDMSFQNFLAIIVEHGYGYSDSMYYAKIRGAGHAGMDLILSDDNIEEMIELYAEKRTVTITVMRGRKPDLISFLDINKGEEAQVPISEIGVPIVYHINDDGVLFPSQGSSQAYAFEATPMQPDDSQAEYLIPQESCNLQNRKGKQIVNVNNKKPDLLSQFLEEFDDHVDEEHAMDEEQPIDEEQDDDYEFVDSDSSAELDDPELKLKISQLKRKRANPKYHMEGDTDPEDLFCEDDGSDDDVVFVEEPVLKKLPVRRGPTDRSHCSSEATTKPEFVPSSDEDMTGVKYEVSDDDGVRYVPDTGEKSRGKKMVVRKWYDEERLQPEDQLCWQMCFADVYQFRRAMVNFHATQRRNYHYHRNCKDRVIVDCLEEGCNFHMTASTVGKEKTFCLRKLNIKHTCPVVGENCKVPTKFVANTIEKTLRTDSGTCVDTVMENTK